MRSCRWDGDASEVSFRAGDLGLATLPREVVTRENAAEIVARLGPERDVDEQARLEGIRSGATSEDHLMHLVGEARDEQGRRYFIAKNSWGAASGMGGYVLLSEAYLATKTVALTLHRDGLPPRVRALAAAETDGRE